MQCTHRVWWIGLAFLSLPLALMASIAAIFCLWRAAWGFETGGLVDEESLLASGSLLLAREIGDRHLFSGSLIQT